MTEKNLRVKAKIAVDTLCSVLTNYLESYPNGLTCTVISKNLDLKSEQNNAQRDYLVYSLLGRLMREDIVEKYYIDEKRKHPRYALKKFMKVKPKAKRAKSLK